jgi:hypothetical protein
MPVRLILLIAAILVSWLVFTGLVKVAKTTIGTALAIAAIVLALQIIFGINPQELWQEIIQLPQTLWQFFHPK